MCVIVILSSFYNNTVGIPKVMGNLKQPLIFKTLKKLFISWHNPFKAAAPPVPVMEGGPGGHSARPAGQVRQQLLT
jgi:hypothetical protein